MIRRTNRRGAKPRAAGSRIGVTAPSGFLAAATAAGIKPGASRDDLALVVSDRPAVAAGVFTTNLVRAAPVLWSSAVVRRGSAVRAVLVNSGNANACTGGPGRAAVRRIAGELARRLGVAPGELLVASTGVIGVPLPLGRVIAALPRLCSTLAAGRRSGARVARAIMTTDTRPKEHAVTVRAGRRIYTVGGVAKGAGMIHPQMATLLAFLTTDAPLSRAVAQRLLAVAAEESFNSVTIDGDTSTNDCVLLLANGAAGGRVRAGGAVERTLASAIGEVCRSLAEKIAADGEGARKLLVVRVRGARSSRHARLVARTVASSPLVKAAVHGGDPNWGRVFAAAGRAGVPLDPRRMELRIGGHLVAAAGAARPAGERPAARHLRGHRVVLDLRLGRGAAEATALGCDLSADYVAINAHYRS